MVSLTPDMKWQVESLTQIGNFYTVAKIEGNSCSCQLVCKYCRICIHAYSCTCLDALLHNTICKHVHIIKLLHGEHDQQATTPESEPNQDTHTYFTDILSSKDTNELSTLKEKLQFMVSKLQVTINECTNIDTLKTINTRQLH